MLNMTFIPIWQRLTRIFFAPVALGFVATSVAVVPAYGATDDNYGQCVVDLTDTGIELANATASCAGARFPGELGNCVFDVSQLTGIGAVNALRGCERSRRPDEVADCAIDIHSALLDQPSVNALEHCSRSLLPERYGNCVVDLNTVADISVNAALDSCVRAGYRPWNASPRQ